MNNYFLPFCTLYCILFLLILYFTIHTRRCFCAQKSLGPLRLKGFFILSDCTQANVSYKISFNTYLSCFILILHRFLFETDIDRIHTFHTPFKIECYNITLRDIANDIINMKKYLSTPARSLIKPNPLASLKNSTLPLNITGSSSSFFGVAIIISSGFISSFLHFQPEESKLSFHSHRHKQSYHRSCFCWITSYYPFLLFFFSFSESLFFIFTFTYRNGFCHRTYI